VLSFRGPDAASFLQGYLTCDTDKLNNTTAIAGAFTNLKGRVVASGWVWGELSDVSMLLPVSVSKTVAEFLKLYMNFSRTKLSIADTSPHATLLSSQTDHQPNHTVRIGTYGAVFTSRDCEEENDSAKDLSETWLEECLACNEAVVTLPVSGAYLPQMLGLTDLGAVAFDKGCYLGQEVVARAQHRGEVKRRLRHASYAPSNSDQPVTLLAAGETLIDSKGKRMGSVICATQTAAQIVTSLTPESAETHELFVSRTTETSEAKENETAAFTLQFSGS
jgi:folate-binding protein YgfZ